MQHMIDINLGVISSQEVEAQEAELELDLNRMQAAKVIAIEKFEELINKDKARVALLLLITMLICLILTKKVLMVSWTKMIYGITTRTRTSTRTNTRTRK